MKKLSVLIITAMLAASLIGCSDNKASSGSEPTTADNTTVQPTTVQATTVQPTTFSENPELIDVTGMRLETATTALQNIGLKVNAIEEYSDEVEEGFVIEQIPKVENGITLKRGDEVKLKVSRGKNTNSAYLKNLINSDEKSDTIYNNFSVYDGNDFADNECTNAMLFKLNHNEDNYSSDSKKSGFATYSVSYDLQGKYTKFKTEITHKGVYDNLKFEIYGDDKLLFSQGLTEKTDAFDKEIDVSKVKIFTIKLKGYFDSFNPTSEIILNNAQFQ